MFLPSPKTVKLGGLRRGFSRVVAVLSLSLKAIVDNVTGFAAIKTQIILETCLALFGSEIYAGNPPGVHTLIQPKHWWAFHSCGSKM